MSIVMPQEDQLQKQESNLLDSLNNSPNSGIYKGARRDDSDDDEFIQNVEQMLTDPRDRKMSNEEILLQAQVIELQMKCNSLASINQKLIKKMEVMGEGESSEDRPQGSASDKDENSYIVGDITEMQNQFTDIEDILSTYRTQLTTYQKEVSQQNRAKHEQIESLNEEIKQLQSQNYNKEKEVNEIKRENQLFKKKNQDLIIELENLNSEYQQLLQWKEKNSHSNQQKNRVYYPNHNNNMNHRNGEDSELEDSMEREYCMEQMERIINQLAEELEYERSLSRKFGEEIKRLNQELKNQELKIQKKNQEKYLLERQMLEMRKIRALDQHDRMSVEVEYYQDEENHKGTKRRSSHRNTLSKNMSAHTNLNSQSSNGITLKKPVTTNAQVYQSNPSPQFNGQSPQKKTQKSSHLHRLVLDELLEKLMEPDPKNEMLSLHVCLKVLELYQETEKKNHNRILISPNNLQIYNLFYDNFDLLRVRILHAHPMNIVLPCDQYFYATLDLMAKIIESYSFEEIEDLIADLISTRINSNTKNISALLMPLKVALEDTINLKRSDNTNA